MKAEDEECRRQEHIARVARERSVHDRNVDQLNRVRARLNDLYAGTERAKDGYGGHVREYTYSTGDWPAVELELQYSDVRVSDETNAARVLLGWNLTVRDEDDINTLLGIN